MAPNDQKHEDDHDGNPGDGDEGNEGHDFIIYDNKNV